MSKLVVCLGYKLNPDNSIAPVLENRIKDAVKLCVENPNSTLLLMGSSLYGDRRVNQIPEASTMKEYINLNFSRELSTTRILTETNTKSTVEQLGYLKKFMEADKLKTSNLVIVSSEFFTERVKLYAEYIFGTTEGIIFVAPPVPVQIADEFKKAEKFKLQEGIKWLSGYKKGDDESILKAQREFQAGVIKGEIKQLPIS